MSEPERSRASTATSIGSTAAGRDSTINIDNSTTTINHGGPALVLPRSMRELVRVYGIEDLPTIADLDPYRLGSTSSVFGRAGEYGLRDGYLPRSAHDVDARLADALVGDRLVVLVGPSKAGKTRTLFEAVRAHDPAARVVWPATGAIGELASHPRIAATTDPLLVWLDDLHEYITGPAGLTPAVLARLTARPGPTVVVATLRSEMRAQLRGGGELRQDTRMLLEQATTIDLASTAEDLDERAAADRAYPGYAGDRYGLGEGLAGAPELLARYDDARAADPALYTVIAVAIDWARIGRTDPIPEPVLTDLARRELRKTQPHLETADTGLRAAIHTARTPPPGAGRTAALHTTFLDDDTRGYRAFDYLTAADDGQDRRTPRPIPDAYWHDATRGADTDTLLRVGITAHDRDRTPAAIPLLREAADAGETFAMFHLSLLLLERGDIPEADNWTRKAADGGVVSNLGALLFFRGEEAEAEAWWRKTAAAGESYAMLSLGLMFFERGELAEAEMWWRKAAAAGESYAMAHLGIMLFERGELAEAEVWYHKSIAAGGGTALHRLSLLLGERDKE